MVHRRGRRINRAHFVALLVLGGCGRIGFGTRPGDDASTAPIEAEIAIDARLATDAPMFTSDAGECPPTYISAGTSCYRMVLSRPFWLDAELACEADAVGAHLATVDSAVEASIIAAIISSVTTDCWVGMTDRVTEGSYRNVTGEAAPYLVWASAEPSSSDCAQFDGVEFHVSDCATTDEYLCEFDGRPAAAGAY